MATHLKHVLNGIFDQSQDWRITLLEKWSTLMGSLKTRVRLERIDGDLVVIGVYEAHWMQELHGLSRTILVQINLLLDTPRVNRVKFILVNARPSTSALRKTASNVPLTPAATKQITFNTAQKMALHAIKDDQLRQALEGFLVSCLAYPYEY